MESPSANLLSQFFLEPTLREDYSETLTESIWIDTIVDDPASPSNKRPRLERANTTTGVLANITGTNSRLNRAPLLAPGRLRSPLGFTGSPVKKTSSTKSKENAPPTASAPLFLHQTLFEATTDSQKSTTSGSENDDPFTNVVNIPSDDSEEYVDIFQGFARIGDATAQQTKSPSAFIGETDTLDLLRPEQYLREQQSPSRPPKSVAKLGRPSLSRSTTTFF